MRPPRVTVPLRCYVVVSLWLLSFSERLLLAVASDGRTDGVERESRFCAIPSPIISSQSVVLSADRGNRFARLFDRNELCLENLAIG